MKDNSENYHGDYFKDAIITVFRLSITGEPVPLGGTFDPMADLTAGAVLREILQIKLNIR
jgi:hypothetical protein